MKEERKTRIIPQKTPEMRQKEKAARRENLEQLYRNVETKLDKLSEKFDRELDKLKE